MISSDDILASVKRAVSVPATQPLLTDPAILAIADEVISSRMVPLLESFDTDFFLAKKIVPLVSAQSDYDIPYRSIGRGLRDLLLNDSQGNLRSLPLIGMEDINLFTMSTDISGFFFRGDKIELVPNVPTNVTNVNLVMWYRLAPNKLMAVSDAGIVTNISYNTGGFDQVTLNTLPSFATVSTDVDFIEKKSGSSILDYDKTIQNIVGNTLYFTVGDVPTSLSVNDYVAPAQYSPVLNNMPDQMIGLLRSHITYRVLNAIGDYEAANIIAKNDIPVEEKDFKSLMQPRIDGEPTVIINRRSLVRGNKFSQRRWLGPP